MNKKKLLSGLSTAAVAAVAALSLTAASSQAADIIYGDANCDGAVTMADAASIFQSIGNPDKYGLSESGKTNADVFNRGDGITAADAISVQKFTASIISELPESWKEGQGTTDPVTAKTMIHLNGASATVEGDYAEVNGGIITISHSGEFWIDGTLTDGQINVNIADEVADAETVKIFLNGVNITGKTAPAIVVTNAENTSINIVDGTENTITDGDAAYAGDWLGTALIEAKDDITFKGSEKGTGVLTITANMQDALVCNNDIKFTGGTVNIDTLNDTDKTNAVNGKTSVTVKETAVLNIDAEGDGLKSSKGDVAIEGGAVTIKAGNDAIQSGTTIDISGGTVVAGGDRGLTAAIGLNITGGRVAATATDNQTDSTLMTGTTQGTFLLNCVDDTSNTDGCWKKTNSFGGFEFTKKFKYVLLSTPDYTKGKEITFDVASNGTAFGPAVMHSGNNTKFAVSGIINTFNEVTILTALPPSDVTDTPTPADGYSVTLSGTSILSDAPADVASSADGKLTISQPGTFAVLGAAKDVQIYIDVDKTAYPEGVVQLDFMGADISNSTTSPIYVNSIGDEVQIVAKAGTVNIISDGTTHTESYTNSDGETVTVEGAIFSKDDLKIKGSGTLTVNGNVSDAIVCKNDLKIYNGTITVNAVDDGLRGKDSVTVGNAADTDFSALKLTVNTTQGDGIKSTGTDASTADKAYGNVTINGGTLDINSYADGIQGEQSVVINGGTIDIYTYEGAGFSGTVSGNTGGWGGSTSTASPDVSAKGIKAVGLYDAAGTTWQSVGDITINGGTITVDSSDDAIHCGGAMNLLGGVMKLATADDGVHSDHDVTIGKGSANTFDDVQIIVSKGYEGIEGLNITMNSGTVICNTTDDGFNAAGGADGSGTGNNMGWRPGGMQTGSGSYSLNLKGGFALVNVTDGDHDGFDSNGSLTISGGYCVTNGNEAFDCDGTKSCTGGIWVENTGSGGMGGGFGGMGGGSLTASVSASGSASKGTRISLVGSDNKVIVSFIAGKNVSNFKAGGSNVSGTFYTGGELSGAAYFQNVDDTQLAAYGGTLTGGTAVK
ncbi:MAG: carbohydrate-binding domain-containing protein [Ruminococcus sp.]|nr:carbohydrate-binding domain-containing protein [Ruminococcus sp.]